jgi:hypothetical protein
MSFRIGRKFAQHTYPEPRTGVPPLALLQIGSDLIDREFGVAANDIVNVVQKTAGPLQVPLNGFQRVNGLWVQISATLELADSGAPVDWYFGPWIKFASLPETFSPTITTQVPVVSNVNFQPDSAGGQLLTSITMTLCALFKLPAESENETPILLPAVDDILVGIAAQATESDVSFKPTTSIVAGEVPASIITQLPEVTVTTIP